MLSPIDLTLIGAFALLVFGPEQLPQIARRAGRAVRDVQAASGSFVREMEEAAAEHDRRPSASPPSPAVASGAADEIGRSSPHDLGSPEGSPASGDPGWYGGAAPQGVPHRSVVLGTGTSAIVSDPRDDEARPGG